MISPFVWKVRLMWKLVPANLCDKVKMKTHVRSRRAFFPRGAGRGRADVIAVDLDDLGRDAVRVTAGSASGTARRPGHRQTSHADVHLPYGLARHVRQRDAALTLPRRLLLLLGRRVVDCPSTAVVDAVGRSFRLGRRACSTITCRYRSETVKYASENRRIKRREVDSDCA
jgi:hypothetical protein